MDKTLSQEQKVRWLFQTISKNYDRANDRISLGFQKSWKQLLIDAVSGTAEKNAAVLDVCCGTGDITIGIAKERPDLRITGIDFSKAMLAEARKKSADCKNINWQEADALKLPFPDASFSAVCISFGLRNTADYAQALKEMRRVLKNGGWLYCLDSFVPDNRFISFFHTLYFKYLVPFLGGGKKYYRQYQWLYESTRKFLRKDSLQQLLKTIGFHNTVCSVKLFGACVLMQGQRTD